jgi:hypothetical protein
LQRQNSAVCACLSEGCCRASVYWL